MNELTSQRFNPVKGPLFQNEGRCSAFDMEIIFHSHANKAHFHKKGCAPSLIESESFRNSEFSGLLFYPWQSLTKSASNSFI